MKIKKRRALVALVVSTLVMASCSSDDDTSTESTEGVTEETGAGSTDPATTDDSTTDPASTDSASTEPPAVATGGTLKFAIDGEPLCYAVSLCFAQYGSGMVTGNVLEPLLKPAENEQAYEPVLAESITANDDFTEFTVVLRPDAVWSDGAPLAATEVKELFQTYLMAPTSPFVGSLSAITAIDAPDDQTLVFTLGAPTAPFPLLISGIGMWRPVPDATAQTIPIGTGPFVIESWESNGITRLVRNDNYGKTDDAGTPLPYLDAVEVTAVVSGDTRLNALEAGEFDTMMSIDPLIVGRIEQTGATATTLETNGGLEIMFNAEKAPLDDARVRRALASATNKDDILSALGIATARDQLWLPTSPWYSEAAAAVSPVFDNAEAATLLQEYIDDPSRSDGQAAGTPITVELKYAVSDQTQESIGILLQQQWNELGVETNLAPVEQNTVFIDAGGGNYDVALSLFAGDPFTTLKLFFDPTAQYTNFNRFANDDVIRIAGEMTTAATSAEFNSLAQQASEVFSDEVPFLPLFSTTMGFGSTDHVTQLSLDAAYGIIDLSTTTVVG